MQSTSNDIVEGLIKKITQVPDTQILLGMHIYKGLLQSYGYVILLKCLEEGRRELREE